jgi:hypothetical protein
MTRLISSFGSRARAALSAFSKKPCVTMPSPPDAVTQESRPAVEWLHVVDGGAPWQPNWAARDTLKEVYEISEIGIDAFVSGVKITGDEILCPDFLLPAVAVAAACRIASTDEVPMHGRLPGPIVLARQAGAPLGMCLVSMPPDPAFHRAVADEVLVWSRFAGPDGPDEIRLDDCVKELVSALGPVETGVPGIDDVGLSVAMRGDAVHGVRRDVPKSKEGTSRIAGATHAHDETRDKDAVRPHASRMTSGALARFGALAAATRAVGDVLWEAPGVFRETFSGTLATARRISSETAEVEAPWFVGGTPSTWRPGRSIAGSPAFEGETKAAEEWLLIVPDGAEYVPGSASSVILEGIANRTGNVFVCGLELLTSNIVSARFMLPALVVSAASMAMGSPAGPLHGRLPGPVILSRDDDAPLGFRLVDMPSDLTFAELVRDVVLISAPRLNQDGAENVLLDGCVEKLRKWLGAHAVHMPSHDDLKKRIALEIKSGGFPPDEFELDDFETASKRFPGRQQLARDDRAERPAAGTQGNGRVVFPVTAKETSRHGRDIAREFKDVTGRELPLLPVPDLSAVRRTLAAEFPHAADVIEGMLRDLGRAPHVRMRPTLLLGKPGSGKTTFARRLLEELGVPLQVFPCGGVADAGLTGCDRKWSTGTPSVPVDLVRRHKVASPGIVLDEITRVGASRNNGNLLDALVGLLEPVSARRWRDPYVAVECDLSAVVWLATANAMDGMDAALRDRFRIVRFPDARAEHVAALARSMALRQSAGAGLDARWFRELDADELGALADHWQGGSLRKLDRLVEAVLGAREGEATLH